MSHAFLKHLRDIPMELAHKGAGSRQLLLSSDDTISDNIEAMTKGYLPVGGIFDWHEHNHIDEICLVLQGNGLVQFDDGTQLEYQKDDLLYFPSNRQHRLVNTSQIENQFYFIRVKDL